MSIVCTRCGKENDGENKFCSRCGLEFATVVQQPDHLEPVDRAYCYRHPKEATELRCGKCDRPICHKCVVISPAGTRCRECSKTKVAFRPMAIWADMKLGAQRILRMGPMSIYFILLIVMMMGGFMRGCFVSSGPPRGGDQHYDQGSPGPE